jgi:non-heme chloroperoxidase
MQRQAFLKVASPVAVDSESLSEGASQNRDAVIINQKPPATQDSFPFVRVDAKTRLFYKDWLPSSTQTARPTKTVLFVHSWSMTSDMWQYQMVHLNRQGIRTIAYDRRGHGRSTDPGFGYDDYDRLADDLAALIEHLDLRDVVLVGHSMGAGEIVRYISRHGSDRVSGIVFLAPTLPFILRTADNPDGMDKAVLDHITNVFAEDLPQWVTDNTVPFFRPDTNPRMIEWAVGLLMQASLKVLIDTNIASLTTDFRRELRYLNVPTLIIQGDKDASAPLDFTGRRTAGLIPGSQLKVYEGAPHGLFLTDIPQLNRDLLAFVQG